MLEAFLAILLFVKIFFVAFSINLVYELLHSLLYKTCWEASLPRYVYLMLKGAAFDGLAIAAIYQFAASVTQERNPFFSAPMILLFAAIALLLAYAWEVIALKNHRWEYAGTMPVILGVGLTPLLQLAFTGLASLYIVFWFY